MTSFSAGVVDKAGTRYGELLQFATFRVAATPLWPCLDKPERF
ncbi:hypothetical protein [Parasphingorhabdus sp.]